MSTVVDQKWSSEEHDSNGGSSEEHDSNGGSSEEHDSNGGSSEEHDSNGGSIEEAIFGWTGGKRLEDLGAGHAPREETFISGTTLG